MDSAKSEMLTITGIAASPGISVGRLRIIDRRRAEVIEYPILPGQIQDEIQRLLKAICDTQHELENLRSGLERTAGDDHLFFIETHLLILSDDRLAKETSATISRDCINAEGALHRTLNRYRDAFASIADPYLRERINDVETIIERVLRNMIGQPHPEIPQSDGKTVLAAHDISPGDMLQIDRNNVVAIITEVGGVTSHTSILARAFEIPAVAGAEGITGIICDGAPVIVDGLAGVVIINPDKDSFQTYLKRKQHFEYIEHELLKTATLSSVTLDGFQMQLKGNVEIPEEAGSVLKHGGTGIGLYRTEILFMNRAEMPGEEEQFQVYRNMLENVAPFPLTIRTLDSGGDKLLQGTDTDGAVNPALGVRAIRLSLQMPDEFKKQLRAILRVSAYGPVRIMFPMISGVEELRGAQTLLKSAAFELSSEGVPFDENMKVGVMIEIPSAVALADILAKEVDFFSVGTNDLIQYTLAIDRSNEQLSYLYQPLHPAVLRSLKRVADVAREEGIEACVCGEMAGDPMYLPVLLGLGFTELSMNAGSIPRVKQILRRCSRELAVDVSQGCFAYSTHNEVEMYLKSQITHHFAESFD